ncbi:MAG: hypothetical protein ACO3BD_00545, partial [Chitinophagaceae bacterium]
MSFNQPDGNMDGSNKKDPRKGFRFNIYWLYGLIAIVLLGFNLFRGFTPDALPTSREDFIDSMLLQNDVASYKVITNKKLVRVTLRPTSVNKPYYQRKFAEAPYKVKADQGPHFQFKVTDVSNFDKQMDEILKANPAITRPRSFADEEESILPS